MRNSWCSALVIVIIVVLGSVLSMCSYGNDTATAPAASERFTSLMNTSSDIIDLTATVSITSVKPPTTQVYRLYCSKTPNLVRVERDLPDGGLLIYFFNKDRGDVCVQAESSAFVLSQASAKRWLLLCDLFTGVMNTTFPKSREVYYAGTDNVASNSCNLFIFDRWGAITKIWVGADHLVHRKEVAGLVYEFADIKLNTNLDREFLGGNISQGNLPVVSEEELMNSIRDKHAR